MNYSFVPILYRDGSLLKHKTQFVPVLQQLVGNTDRARAWFFSLDSHSFIQSLIKTDKTLLHNKNEWSSMKRYE